MASYAGQHKPRLEMGAAAVLLYSCWPPIEVWSWLVIWVIIFCVMAAFYRRLWIALATAGVALLIAYSQACKDIGLWFIIPASICLAMTIPFILQDFKLSRTQALKDKIAWIRESRPSELALHEEKELGKLEEATLFQWIISWFKRNQST